MLTCRSGNNSPPPPAQQRNLKQRFIALLKKFKVPEGGLQAYETDADLDPRAGGERGWCGSMGGVVRESGLVGGGRCVLEGGGGGVQRFIFNDFNDFLFGDANFIF